MKKLKYLILLILIIPIMASAEAVHLTQADIEEAYANIGVDIERTQLRFVLRNSCPGFYFRAEEYILDEDIDLHQGFLAPTGQKLVINLNGHDIKNELPLYENGFTYSVIRDIGEAVDITINGPGKVYTELEYVEFGVNIHGGVLNLNNLELIGSIRGASEHGDCVINLNNVTMTGRFQLWNKSTINIDNSTLNSKVYNSVISGYAYINNTVINYVGDVSNNGIEFRDNSDIGAEYIASKGVIKNSKISGKNAALWLEKNCEVTVENTELIGLQYAALYVKENPKLTMSDVYLHNEGSVNDYQVISGYVDNDNVVDYFNQFVKEGYIYWKDPEYKNGDTYSSMNKGMQNHNLWIIKQQQEYENEDNTYVIPEDNEIIIKVSGYKVLLEDIMINGEVVPNTNYELLDSDDNEVIIKLSSDYLKTLEANDYDVEVVFVNGSSKSKLTIQDAEVKNEEETPVIVVNPKTGLISYTYLLVIAIIAGITAIIIGKKSYFKSK